MDSKLGRKALLTLRAAFKSDALTFAGLCCHRFYRYSGDPEPTELGGPFVGMTPAVSPFFSEPVGYSAQEWSFYESCEAANTPPVTRQAAALPAWNRFRVRADQGARWLRANRPWMIGPVYLFCGPRPPAISSVHDEWLSALFYWAIGLRNHSQAVERIWICDGRLVPDSADQELLRKLAASEESQQLARLADGWPRERPLTHFATIHDVFVATVAFIDWLLSLPPRLLALKTTVQMRVRSNLPWITSALRQMRSRTNSPVRLTGKNTSSLIGQKPAPVGRCL
jgi:hypothetical protein